MSSRIPRPTPPRARSGTAARSFGTHRWDDEDEACCPFPTVSPPRAPPPSQLSRLPKPTPPHARSGTAARREEGFLSECAAQLSRATQTLDESHTPPSKLCVSTAAALANVTEQLTAAQERLSKLEQQRLEAETPPHLRCPISLQRMCSPVIVADGHTFERRSIEEWLRRHNTNPLTGATLRNRALVPSLALRDATRAWEVEHGRSPTPRPSPRPSPGGEESEIEEDGPPRAEAPAVAAAISAAAPAPTSNELDALIHELEEENAAFELRLRAEAVAEAPVTAASESLRRTQAIATAIHGRLNTMTAAPAGNRAPASTPVELPESRTSHTWSELHAQIDALAERQTQMGVPHRSRAGSGAASTDTPAELQARLDAQTAAVSTAIADCRVS